MKILITGASGQLGADCCEVLRHDHTLVEMSKQDLDITNEKAVIEALKEHTPEIVLNCAATAPGILRNTRTVGERI